MKSFQTVLLIMFFAVAFAGCATDLVVQNVDVTWNETTKKAEAKISNIGNQDAGKFMINLWYSYGIIKGNTGQFVES
jgi:hypothetical protein